VIGLIAQIALLAVLSRTAGLEVAGWLAGLACGLTTTAALTRGLARSGASGLGPANRMTLARATLVGGVAALVADAYARPAPVAAVVMLAVVSLVLDAADGWIARRTSTVSALGARFDMEVDAFLILVLSTYVAGSVGPWVLAIGAARYVYVVVGWLRPWLRASVPPRYWRKTVAATQGIVLTVAAAGVLPGPEIDGVLAIALALLAESFGRDVWWLRRRHRSDTRPTVERRRILVAAGSPAPTAPG
jgi:phosphatidylglycerophosphate synthase